MLRSMSVIGLSLLLGAASVAPAWAQLPFSLRVSAVGGLQQGEVTASVNGAGLGSASTTLFTAGVELDVGTPIGLHVGGTYLRHFGDLSNAYEDIPDALAFGLGANEYGVFVEKRFSVAPVSPLAPYLGLGGAYGRISLAQELDSSAFTARALEGDVDIFRLYALGGLDLFGSVGMKARLGYVFGSIEGGDLAFGEAIETGSGDEVAFEIAYDGVFATIALALFGF